MYWARSAPPIALAISESLLSSGQENFIIVSVMRIGTLQSRATSPIIITLKSPSPRLSAQPRGSFNVHSDFASSGLLTFSSGLTCRCFSCSCIRAAHPSSIASVPSPSKTGLAQISSTALRSSSSKARRSSCREYASF